MSQAMKIQHFYVNPAILLSGAWTINYRHRETARETSREFLTFSCVMTGDERCWLVMSQVVSQVRSCPWCWGVLGISAVIWSVSMGSLAARGADTVSHVLTLGTQPICNNEYDGGHHQVLTPRAALDNDFLTATQDSRELQGRETGEIILAIVHCNWSRTLAMLSYLNIPQSMFGIEVSPGSSVNRDQIQQNSTEQLEQL